MFVFNCQQMQCVCLLLFFPLSILPKNKPEPGSAGGSVARCLLRGNLLDFLMIL